jgi:DNA-binding MarR family transcriptional regulator
LAEYAGGLPKGARRRYPEDTTAGEIMTTSPRRSAKVSPPDSPAPVLGGLDDDIGLALRLAQLAVFRDITTALREVELRPSDFSALMIIEANPGLKQQAIGELLVIRKPNLVSMIDTLVGRGLIDRRSPPGDRRSYSLHLTAAGHDVLSAAKSAHQAHGARVRAMFAGADAEHLLRNLRTLAQLPGAGEN